MNYVYKRLKFMNNRYVSQLSALVFLAVWHGWHVGYYVTFFNEFIVMNFEREWASIWSKSGKHNKLLISFKNYRFSFVYSKSDTMERTSSLQHHDSCIGMDLCPLIPSSLFPPLPSPFLQQVHGSLQTATLHRISFLHWLAGMGQSCQNVASIRKHQGKEEW